MSDDEQQLPCVNLKALNSSYTIDVKMLPCKTSSISPDKVYKTTELDQLYPEPKETTDGKEVLYLRGRKLIGEVLFWRIKPLIYATKVVQMRQLTSN